MAELIFISLVVIILIFLVYRIEIGLRRILYVVERNGRNIQDILKKQQRKEGNIGTDIDSDI
jgi:predicted Holliday junction resolvase-like endonuclease